MITPARLGVLLAAAGLLACSPTLDSPPAGALITCTSDAECPSGFFCSQALEGRCVQRGSSDQTPPTVVGTPSVVPAAARAGSQVTVSFEVSEDLAAPPEVRFQGEATTLGAPSRAGRVYTVEFPVVTAMGDGVHTIVARLVDFAGNVAETVPVGTLALDFTPPDASLPVFSPAFARVSSVVTGSITFTEPLGAAPVLTLGSSAGPSFGVAPGGGANTWTFARTLDGTEPPGPSDLLLSAADAAGNPLERRYTDAVTLDFTPPRVSDATIGTPSVRRGDTFVASLVFDEPLAGAPVVELVPVGGGAGLAVTVSALDASHYALYYDVPPGASDGAFTLTLVSAEDRAGNPVAEGPLGPVTFDSTPPEVSGLAPDHPNRLYRAGQAVGVAFTLSEDVPVLPDVRLGATGGDLALPCAAGAPRSYTCTSSPLPATLLDGTASVSVSVADAAGNSRIVSTAILLDFTLPELASAPATRYLGSPTTRGVDVRAVGIGSSWEIAILASERLAAPPAVVALEPGGGATRALVLQASNDPINTSFTYVLTASATAYPAGTWTVTWDPVDLAGNQAATPVQIATVDVDGIAPPSPATGPAAAPTLVWTRTPWGTDTSAEAAFELSATAAAVGPDAEVLVAWDGAGAGAREVARAGVGAGGGFTMALGADPADLWVSTLDRAGNESPRTRVVDVVWTAGLAGKVAGSTFENPHRFELRQRSLGALAQLDGVEASAGDLGVRGDGEIVASAAASAYRPVGGLADPGPRIYYALGADPGRGVVVLYSGMLQDSTTPGDTWEWNGTAWRQVYPSDPEGDGGPPKSSQFNPLVYDPIRGGLVTFAQTGLWLWNGQSWKRIATAPSPGGSIAWDARRAVILLFDTSGQTWEWNGAAWRNAAPASAPSARGFAALYYDTEIEQVCLYGGRTQAGTYLADLWCYTGTTWTPQAQAGAVPFPRSDYAFAYDALREELFLQSGRPQASTTPEGRTYALRRVGGTPTWFDVTPQILGLTSHAATYDPSSRRVLMLGSRDVGLYAFRAWDGAAYSTIAPGDPQGDGNPSFLFRTSNPVYVPSRGVTVFPQTGGSPLQTWEWDRASWALRATGGGPTAQSGMSVGWYGSNVIAFGGQIANTARRDTWSWNGSAWTELVSNPSRAGASTNDETFRTDAGMATDPATGRLYRVGGYDVVFTTQAVSTCYLDVWEWTGSAWTKIAGAPTDPEGDGNPSSAFLVYPPCSCREKTIWSPALNTLLVYHNGTGDIWEWRRATNSWARHAMTGHAPSALQGFFWDTTLNAPVVVDYTGPYLADLASNVYVPIAVTNPFGPTPPTGATLAFDTGAGTAVAVEALPWVWQSPATGTPAHLFTVDFARANGPDPAACVAGAACAIQRIDVTWSGGGTAPTANGATLQAWTGGWRDAASTTATVASPAPISWTWPGTSGIPAAALFGGPARELTFALVPTGSSSAAGMAQVGTDAVSVTFRYRRP